MVNKVGGGGCLREKDSRKKESTFIAYKCYNLPGVDILYNFVFIIQNGRELHNYTINSVYMSICEELLQGRCQWLFGEG